MRTLHGTDDQADDQANDRTDQALRWRRVAALDGQVARALEDVNAALGALEVALSERRLLLGRISARDGVAPARGREERTQGEP